MTILKWLEGQRTPWLDGLMSAITELGDETIFMLAGLVILWCVNKRWGFRFLLVGLTGSIMNQLLKAIFLIPRPWVQTLPWHGRMLKSEPWRASWLQRLCMTVRVPM